MLYSEHLDFAQINQHEYAENLKIGDLPELFHTLMMKKLKN